MPTIDQGKLLDHLADMRAYCLRQSVLYVVADPEISTRYDGRVLFIDELVKIIESGQLA